MRFNWLAKDIPGLGILHKSWDIPDWFVRACILLFFLIPATVYTGTKSLMGEGSLYAIFFMFAFGVTGFVLIPVLGFLLQKSVAKRFGDKSFRFVAAILVISLFSLLASTVFRDIIEDGLFAVRSLY